MLLVEEMLLVEDSNFVVVLGEDGIRLTAMDNGVCGLERRTGV